MFDHKAIFLIDIDTSQDDPATILQQFNAAYELFPSMVQIAVANHAKLLECAKENILNTQGEQKNHEKKHCNLPLTRWEPKYCYEEKESMQR